VAGGRPVAASADDGEDPAHLTLAAVQSSGGRALGAGSDIVTESAANRRGDCLAAILAARAEGWRAAGPSVGSDP
jgi:hypothetical protein